MNWNAVKGAKGRCKVGIHKWTGNDGKEHENNEITAFLEPSEQPAIVPQPQGAAAYTQSPLTSSRKWTGGQF